MGAKGQIIAFLLVLTMACIVGASVSGYLQSKQNEFAQGMATGLVVVADKQADALKSMGEAVDSSTKLSQQLADQAAAQTALAYVGIAAISIMTFVMLGVAFMAWVEWKSRQRGMVSRGK